VTCTSLQKLTSKERFQDLSVLVVGSQLSPIPSTRMVRRSTPRNSMRSNGLSHIRSLRPTTKLAMSLPWRLTTSGTLCMPRTTPSRFTQLKSSRSKTAMERPT
jgi:hypothetical protein